MSGNFHASTPLSPYDPETKRGYITHAVTTGLSSKLYEGVTIAEFSPTVRVQRRSQVHRVRGANAVTMTRCLLLTGPRESRMSTTQAARL